MTNGSLHLSQEKPGIKMGLSSIYVYICVRASCWRDFPGGASGKETSSRRTRDIRVWSLGQEDPKVLLSAEMLPVWIERDRERTEKNAVVLSKFYRQ